MSMTMGKSGGTPHRRSQHHPSLGSVHGEDEHVRNDRDNKMKSVNDYDSAAADADVEDIISPLFQRRHVRRMAAAGNNNDTTSETSLSSSQFMPYDECLAESSGSNSRNNESGVNFGTNGGGGSSGHSFEPQVAAVVGGTTSVGSSSSSSRRRRINSAHHHHHHAATTLQQQQLSYSPIPVGGETLISPDSSGINTSSNSFGGITTTHRRRTAAAAAAAAASSSPSSLGHYRNHQHRHHQHHHHSRREHLSGGGLAGGGGTTSYQGNHAYSPSRGSSRMYPAPQLGLLPPPMLSTLTNNSIQLISTSSPTSTASSSSPTSTNTATSAMTPTLQDILKTLCSILLLRTTHFVRLTIRKCHQFSRYLLWSSIVVCILILILAICIAKGFYNDATRLCVPPPLSLPLSRANAGGITAVAATSNKNNSNNNGYSSSFSSSTRPLVEYYVHGRGNGHYARSIAIVERLNDAGVDVRMFLGRASMWRAFHDKQQQQQQQKQKARGDGVENNKDTLANDKAGETTTTTTIEEGRGTATAIAVTSIDPSLDILSALSHILERIIGDCEVAIQTHRYPLLIVTDGDVPGMLRGKLGGIPSVGISHGQTFVISSKPTWVSQNKVWNRAWDKQAQLNGRASYFCDWQIGTNFIPMETTVSSAIVARPPMRPEVVQMAEVRRVRGSMELENQRQIMATIQNQKKKSVVGNSKQDDAMEQLASPDPGTGIGDVADGGMNREMSDLDAKTTQTTSEKTTTASSSSSSSPQDVIIANLLLYGTMKPQQRHRQINETSSSSSSITTTTATVPSPLTRRKLVICYFRDKNGDMITDALLQSGFDVVLFERGYHHHQQQQQQQNDDEEGKKIAEMEQRFGTKWIIKRNDNINESGDKKRKQQQQQEYRDPMEEYRNLREKKKKKKNEFAIQLSEAVHKELRGDDGEKDYGGGGTDGSGVGEKVPFFSSGVPYGGNVSSNTVSKRGEVVFDLKDGGGVVSDGGDNVESQLHTTAKQEETATQRRLLTKKAVIEEGEDGGREKNRNDLTQNGKRQYEMDKNEARRASLESDAEHFDSSSPAVPPARIIRITDQSLFVPIMSIADGVASSAGSQLLSECIYANVPLFALYKEGDDEQMLNVEMSRHMDHQGGATSGTEERRDGDSGLVYGTSFENFEKAFSSLTALSQNKSNDGRKFGMGGYFLRRDGSGENLHQSKGEKDEEERLLSLLRAQSPEAKFAHAEFEKFVRAVNRSTVSASYYRDLHRRGTMSSDGVVSTPVLGLEHHVTGRDGGASSDEDRFRGMQDAADVILEIIKHVMSEQRTKRSQMVFR